MPRFARLLLGFESLIYLLFKLLMQDLSFGSQKILVRFVFDLFLELFNIIPKIASFRMALLQAGQSLKDGYFVLSRASDASM